MLAKSLMNWPWEKQKYNITNLKKQKKTREKKENLRELENDLKKIN